MYIVVIRDASDSDAFEFVGPFKSVDEACAWSINVDDPAKLVSVRPVDGADEYLEAQAA